MKQCAILVGGLGTRLGKLTEDCPKPLLEVQGRPFVDNLIERADSMGFEEVILLASYHAQQVIDRYHGKTLSNGGMIKVHCEEEPSGTGGAIWNALDILQDQFLLLNGDSILDANWLTLYQSLDRKDADAALALTMVEDQSRYGGVVLENDHVIQFKEKEPDNKSEGLINAGVYALRKTALLPFLKSHCSLERDILPHLAKKGTLFGSVLEGYFIDMGLPETLEECRKNLSEKLKHEF